MPEENKPAVKVNPDSGRDKDTPPKDDGSESTEGTFEAVSEPATGTVRKITRFSGANKYEIEG